MRGSMVNEVSSRLGDGDYWEVHKTGVYWNRKRELPMRLMWIGLAAAVLTATAAFASDPNCGTNVQSYATTDLGGIDVPVVPRGEKFAVACDSIRSSGADVSV